MPINRFHTLKKSSLNCLSNALWLLIQSFILVEYVIAILILVFNDDHPVFVNVTIMQEIIRISAMKVNSAMNYLCN